jgi:hypothetical protein
MERAAHSRHLPFLTAYAKAKRLYSLDMNEDDFIEAAYYAWRQIGNIAPTINKFFVTLPDDSIIELPETCEFVQSVTQLDNPKQFPTFDSGGPKDRQLPSVQVVEYQPTRNQSQFASYGESVNYELLNKNTIKVTSPDLLGRDIQVVFMSMNVGEDGLPLLNDKEVSAIAAEVARQIMTAKMSGMVGKQTSMAQAQVSTTMLQFITQEAARLMAAAKIDEKINDDGLDKMLDIKTSWDRKIYGKRWNPLK